jgi:hydroxymethylpyrimidine/phosphomethylpyrimidine kinase
MRTALTIAGSDSSGGAGIQADLKTFAAHGVFGTSAITAITVQNTRGVEDVVPLSPDLVVRQIDAVLDDLGAGAIKIGMLATAPIVTAVARALAARRPEALVLDPVIAASGGAPLLDPEGIGALLAHLLPLAAVVTPNGPEAAILTGLSITSSTDLGRAARRLVALGARAAVVTGGHLAGPAIDVLCDGRSLTELRADRIATVHTHGTGCTFSAAIAARLALGDDLPSAVRAAKAYVTRAIEQAPGLGHGHGPLQHFPR